MFINYEYIETESKDIKPDGEGWEYWSDRITPDVHVAVWRRVVEQTEI
jgi:hypothetical protein